MGQLVGFLLHPPLSEIAKKSGKMLKYTPHFQSAFGTAVYYHNIVGELIFFFYCYHHMAGSRFRIRWECFAFTSFLDKFYRMKAHHNN